MNAYLQVYMWVCVVYKSVVKIVLLLTFLHSWNRIQLSCLANLLITCPSTEILWSWFSLLFCALEFMILKNSLYFCFTNFQEELKSHKSVQFKWVFSWPSLFRSPRVFQNVPLFFLKPYCFWTMHIWMVKEIFTFMMRSTFSLFFSLSDHTRW